MKYNPIDHFKTHQAKQEILKILERHDALNHQTMELKPHFDIGRIAKQKFISWGKKKSISIKGGLKGAKEGDIVLVKLPACRIVDIVETKQKLEVGYLYAHKKQKAIYHIKTHRMIPAKAKAKSLLPLPPFTLFGIEPDGTIKHVLGHLLDAHVDEKIVLATHATLEPFSKQSLTEAKSFGDAVDASLYQDRIDLRHLNFCTIDPDDAKDFDDAIYYDPIKQELYVAIADVSEYVTPYSALDKDAQKRGFSIYLPHKAIPMLPPVLSEHLCSLKPLEDRLAFTWKITLDHNAQPSETQLFLSIIQSKCRLTYTQANQILQQENSQDPIEAMLQALFIQTQKIKKQRLDTGYDFFTEEEKILLDEHLNFVKTITHTHMLSHELIEECMLLANTASAKLMQKYLPAGIYRTHIPPQQDRIIELFSYVRSLGYHTPLGSDIHKSITALQQEAQQRQEQKAIDALIIKAQAQAQYTTHNQGHFGLGFEAYAHFTSPIRRYVDLHLHRLLKSISNTKHINHLIKDLQKICDDANMLERSCALAEMEFKDRVYARWAKEHEGYTLEATIIDERYPAIAKAKNPITGARLWIDTEGLTPLQDVIVQITHSDILEAKIHCTYIKDAYVS